MQDVIVDEEFSSLIPPLTIDELYLLEGSIVKEGCRDALIVWAETGILLDGHNRKRICELHDIPYRTTGLSFPDRESAADWIDANQLGRRNLTPDQMSLLRGRRYNRLKRPAHAGENQYSRGGDQFDTHLDTADRLASQYGVSAPTIKRDGQFAGAVDTLTPFIPDITQRVMTGDIPSRQAVIEAAEEPEHAEEKLIPHVARNGGDNEWYTPKEYIEAARSVMGDIVCDPASTEIANTIVGAAQYFDIDNDGLSRMWIGPLWMNPPYAQPAIARFCAKLVDEVQAGRVTQAIVLVNNATETEWFQSIARISSAMCFPKGRVKFWHPEKVSAPLQGQALLYIGSNAAGFLQQFESFGIVVWR